MSKGATEKFVLPCHFPNVMLTPWANPLMGVGGALTVLRQLLLGTMFNLNLSAAVLVIMFTSAPESTMHELVVH